MKKKTLRIITLIVLVVMILSAFSSVFAAPTAKGDATMTLVKDEIASGTFGENNYGAYRKEKVNFDSAKKTIDIKLTVTNNAPEPSSHEEEIPGDVPGEIVYLIDISNSMSVNPITINNETTTRKAAVIAAAKILTDKLFAQNKDLKVGVVGYATSTQQQNPDERGTLKDAKIFTNELVTTKEAVNSVFDTVATTTMGNTTDIQMGLRAAASLFTDSTTAKKYIVLLTDGIPNVAEGVIPTTKQAPEQGWESAYDMNVFNPTKAEVKGLKDKGINLVSILINMLDNELPFSTMTPGDMQTMYEAIGRDISEAGEKPTYLDVSKYIFGTTTKPTTGDVYYIPTDDEIYDYITKTVYDSMIGEPTKKTVVDVPEYVLEDIVLKDYFPANIVANFDKAELIAPSKGTITAKIDTKDNSITWTIGDLKPQETATYTYRLTLKDTFDSSIIGKNLPTNEKITITYKENGKDGKPVEDTRCPVVALDVAPKKNIPQTGENTILFVGLALLATASIAVVSKVKSRK
jgi:hypothetical protein